MGGPGSPGVEPGPQAFEVPDITDLQTPSTPDAVDRNRLAADGARFPEANTPTAQGGGFTQAGDANAARWKLTPSSS